MKVVLLATSRPEWVRLAETAGALRDLGAQVYLATTFDPKSGLRPNGIVETRQLRMDLTGRRRGVRPRRLTPRWVKTVARNIVVHAHRRVSGGPVRTWLAARYDPWFRGHASTADALVAMERPGVYAVWKSARRWGVDRALLGPDPLIQQFGKAKILGAVERLVALGPHSPEDVLDAWLEIADESAHPSRQRLLARSPRIVRALRQARAFDHAERVARSALGLEIAPEVSVRLKLELTTIQIAQMVEPEFPLESAVSEVLEQADQYLIEGKLGVAADLAQRVSEAVFHRELHADVESTPLVESPDQFLAPLRRSLTYRALSARPGEISTQQSSTGDPVAPGPSHSGQHGGYSGHDRRRLLVISGGNLHFTRRMIDDVEGALDLDVRWIDLKTEGATFDRRNRWTTIHDRLTEAVGGSVPELSADAREILAWPDVAFIDWCDLAAQWAAIHLPRQVRLIIRIHSLEVISPEPHMLDWSRVSDLVFVSEHVRELAERSIPELARVGRIHVLPNEMDLVRFGLAKTESADRTVAMIGWAQRVKDPVWALDVLARLREKDARWKLLLIGADFADSQTTGGYAYRDEFRERVRREDVEGGVEYIGYTEDLPKAMRDVGFILSASRREGFPVGPTEAIASGAVPIIRDWPMYASYGGASGVYPNDWVVTSPRHAAERILAHADSEHRAQAAKEASEYVVSKFDWTVVAPMYRRIFANQDVEVSL